MLPENGAQSYKEIRNVKDFNNYNLNIYYRMERIYTQSLISYPACRLFILRRKGQRYG